MLKLMCCFCKIFAYNMATLDLLEVMISYLVGSACDGAYLSSYQRRASNANYWTIRTLFIAMTTSCLEESAPA